MADNLTPEQRSRTMAAVKCRDTSLERKLDAAFREFGWAYSRNDHSLPGRPDFVFSDYGLIVFVDGDFWHGWRFPQWRSKLSPYWQQKIERDRRRDRANFRRLRKAGWRVLRVWGHQVERDLSAVVQRVAGHVKVITPGKSGRQGKCLRIGE